jgi:hypothetical protein
MLNLQSNNGKLQTIALAIKKEPNEQTNHRGSSDGGTLQPDVLEKEECVCRTEQPTPGYTK